MTGHVCLRGLLVSMARNTSSHCEQSRVSSMAPRLRSSACKVNRETALETGFPANTRGLPTFPVELLLEVLSHTSDPHTKHNCKATATQVLGKNQYFTNIIPTLSFSAQCGLACSMGKDRSVGYNFQLSPTYAVQKNWMAERHCDRLGCSARNCHNPCAVSCIVCKVCLHDILDLLLLRFPQSSERLDYTLLRRYGPDRVGTVYGFDGEPPYGPNFVL